MTLSNPPVHLGAQPDFTVLTKLLSDARRRLRPDGEAWIVAQRYVPMGAMCAAAGAGDATCVDVDDRFAVWVVKNKLLKDRRSPRGRGRVGTSVMTERAEETTTTTKEKKEKKKKKDSKDSKDSKKKKKKEKREKKR
jgi:hypothetical protein